MTRHMMPGAALILVLAAAAHGDELTYVSSDAVAEGDSVRIQCTVVGGTRLADRSLVVEAAMLGNCDDVATVTPAPATIAADDAAQHFTFVVRPADLHRVYRYRARLVDDQGNLTNAPGSVFHPNGGYVSCREGLIGRGRLNTWPCGETVCFLECANQCWAPCPANVELPLDTASWQPWVDTGVIVDLYGTVSRPRSLWDMPGTPCMTVTRVAPVTDPAGCAAVSEEPVSWGAVKALYR